MSCIDLDFIYIIRVYTYACPFMVRWLSSASFYPHWLWCGDLDLALCCPILTN
jgi:hypothetical protein